MAEIADDHILSLILSGNKVNEGYRLLLEKYREQLYWHVRRMVIHHEDADDVLQNTFVKIFKNLNRFESKSKLYTWMYRIASNEAITHLKKQKRNASTSIDDEQIGLSDRLEADTFFDGDEVMKRLYLALDTLPEKQRLVFNMRYFDEMSYQDISDTLGTSVGGLKASYHHAAKKIEQYFKTAQVGM